VGGKRRRASLGKMNMTPTPVFNSINRKSIRTNRNILTQHPRHRSLFTLNIDYTILTASLPHQTTRITTFKRWVGFKIQTVVTMFPIPNHMNQSALDLPKECIVEPAILSSVKFKRSNSQKTQSAN
jgi:hypothetical protein